MGSLFSTTMSVTFDIIANVPRCSLHGYTSVRKFKDCPSCVEGCSVTYVLYWFSSSSSGVIGNGISSVGDPVGDLVGFLVGPLVGAMEGTLVGDLEGVADGAECTCIVTPYVSPYKNSPFWIFQGNA